MALITDPSGPSGLIIDRQTFPSPTLRKCDLKGFVPSQSRGEENNLLHASGFHGVSGCLVAEKQKYLRPGPSCVPASAQCSFVGFESGSHITQVGLQLTQYIALNS